MPKIKKKYFQRKKESQNYVIFGKHDKGSEHDWTRNASKNKMDHFERFISILKFPIFEQTQSSEFSCENERKKLKKDTISKEEDSESNVRVSKQTLNDMLESLDTSKFKRSWRARRVDLIICPIDQYPFASIGIQYN